MPLVQAADVNDADRVRGKQQKHYDKQQPMNNSFVYSYPFKDRICFKCTRMSSLFLLIVLIKE